MIKNWHMTLFLLIAIGYVGCGGTLERGEIGLGDSEMAELIQEQDTIAQEVTKLPVQIDLEKLNTVQEKLAEERE